MARVWGSCPVSAAPERVGAALGAVRCYTWVSRGKRVNSLPPVQVIHLSFTFANSLTRVSGPIHEVCEFT